MNFEPAAPLRTSTNLGDLTDGENGNGSDGGGFETIADLVAELLELTDLVSRDRLAAARGRAGTGSLAQALYDEGAAEPSGVARSLARRHDLPYLDLADNRVAFDAAELIPLRTLRRVVAVPIAFDGERLKIAIADPANILGIDELKLATRHALDLHVANREDIVNELDRLSKQSEVIETQSVLDQLEVVEEEDDLEVDDGVSDAPLVRLVNSIIMRRPPTARATSTSSRRTTRSWCARGSTAC